MIQNNYKKIVSFLVAILLVIFVNGLIFHGYLGRLVVRLVEMPATYIFERSSYLRQVAGNIADWKVLAGENDALKMENGQLEGDVARLESVMNENTALRRALNLPIPSVYKKEDANIFFYNFIPGGYNLTINKGDRDGVHSSDIVVTTDGILVGKVSHVYEDYSAVTVVSDPSFKAAARILGGNTNAIAKGSFSDGVYLDVVSQDDVVSVGDMVATSGDDNYPAGLIIGTIYRISDDKSKLFKGVWLKPEFLKTNFAKVLVLSK